MGLDSVSEDVLTLPAPAGHLLRSAAVDDRGQVWFGSLDGGLSVLDPRTNRFRLLTRELEPFGGSVDKILWDGKRRRMLLKVGYGDGRLVEWPVEGKGGPRLIKPPRLPSRDHTRFDQLDTRPDDRRWITDMALTPEGDLWVTRLEPQAGIFAQLDAPHPTFLPAQDRLKAPDRLTPDPSGDVMWAISGAEATAWEVKTLQPARTLTFAPPPTLPELQPGERALAWGTGDAAVVDHQLWIASRGEAWSQRGSFMAPTPMLRALGPSRFVGMRAVEDRLWLQLDHQLLSLRAGASRVQAMPQGYLPERAASRILAFDSRMAWFGSAHGVVGYDVDAQTPHAFTQPLQLPAPQPRYRPHGPTDRWLREPGFSPQLLLQTQIGALLATSGAPPTRFNPETGLWDNAPATPGSIPGFAIQTTAMSFDGLPVLVLQDGVSRWEPEVNAFGRPIRVDLGGEDRRLDIAIDQLRGVTFLACPRGEEHTASQCDARAYLPWNSADPLPVNASLAGRCIHPIDNGPQGWRTSTRQAILTCSPESFLLLADDPILPGSIRQTVREALIRLVFPQGSEFKPLTPIASKVPVSWGVVQGRPAVWLLGEPIRVLEHVRDLPLEEPLDHRRFAVDEAGNLCALRTDGEVARVRCINAFGSEVAAWRDERDAAGALGGARLLASGSGHLWIDGLRGRVAWLARNDHDLHVVPTDAESSGAPYFTRPLSRVMGFHRGQRAWVEGEDVLEVEPRADAYGRPVPPFPVSATRLYQRRRWPMAAVTIGGISQLVLALPQELFLVRLGTAEERAPLTAQPVRAEADQDVGPWIDLVEPGHRPGEVWVGLRDGGVLHYRPGRAIIRFSQASGITTPTIHALTAVGDGAVAATPDGLYWLRDLGDGRPQATRLRLPELGAPVTALEALDDGLEQAGTPLFIATADRAILSLRLPVESPRSVLTPEEASAADKGDAWTAGTLAPREVARLHEALPTSLLAVLPDVTSSEQGEIYIGTNNGLYALRPSPEGWERPELSRVNHREGLPTSGEVTALAALPDGRVAAAYWNEVRSHVLLHEPESARSWTVRLKAPSSKVYALAAITAQEGAGFLAVRQPASLALSSLPIFHTAQPSRWPWLVGGGIAALLLGVTALVLLRRKNPLVERLKLDPDAIRELDLGVLGEADRSLRNLRRPILTAAGVEPRRWELAVELGDAWAALHAPEPTPEHRAAAAELIAQALDAQLKERVAPTLESGRPFAAFTVELPRLPVNLPTAETTLFVITEHDAAHLLGEQPQPRAVEDLLGHLLRQLNQSMGTPFLLATSLPAEVNLPSLVHARFPALILRAPRLRQLALHPQPRKALAQAILTESWLDAISPYKSSGPVEDPAMFVGRERERRELVAARSVSAIICGGRRVGKTSLIRQLVRDLQQERPDMSVFEVSLLGIRSYTDFIDRLERRLGITLVLQDAPHASAEIPPDDADLSPALARIRRRRARRSNPSLSPETAAAAVHEALEAWCVQQPTPPLLILDEIDGIAARDAEAGYPLLAALHQLKSEGTCSFVLVGFAELYRQTFDYDSPLYNFARVMQLGPLDPQAARRLILDPLARLGVELEDDAIADRIVEATAAFPNLVQFIGDMLLRTLSQKGKLRVEHDDLDHLLNFAHPDSQPLSAYVAESFDQNVARLEELLVYTLLLHGPRPSSLGDIATNLERLGLETDLATRRSLVRRLKLVGVLKELPGEHFDLALPLLVQLLQAKDLEMAVAALTAELEGR